MSLNISSKILSFPGQIVKGCQHDLSTTSIKISCERDSRFKLVNHSSGLHGKLNKRIKRTVRDMPLFGFDCHVEIELAQVRTSDGKRVIEENPLVDKGVRYTKRFCQFISGLCRHMSIDAVSKHLSIRWNTVKDIDKRYLQKTLPALNPSELKNLKYIGVDEVARAKGHDYMTVVYCSGLIAPDT